MAAKIIGQAAIRLRASETGLANEIKGIVSKAVAQGVRNIQVDTTKKIEEDAKKSSANVKSIFTETFSTVGQIAGRLVSPALSGARLLTLGAAAGSALAGVGALSAGLIAVVGAAAQAAGAVGILPAGLAAVQAVTATLKIGLSGVSDTLSALASGDTEAFNQGLAKLTPNARDAVRAIAGFKPAFDDLKVGVQQRLFEGLGDEIRQLGERYLPVARGLFQDIASELNQGARGAAEFLRSGTALDQVGASAGNISSAVGVAADSFKPLTAALVGVVAAGSTQLPRLATAFSNVSSRFGEFIQQEGQAGRLEAFFSNSLDVASQLGSILGNLGGTIGAVFGTGMGTGRGLLTTFEQNTAALREFVNSAEGSGALEAFFDSIATVGAQVQPILRELALLIGGDVAPLLSNLAAGVGPGVVAIINQLRETVTAATPGVVELGAAFGRILVAIAPILPTLGQLIGQFASGLAGALTSLAGPLTTVINYLASSPGVLAGLLGAVGALALGLGPLSGLISTLSPIISNLVTNAGGLRAVLTAITGPVGIAVALFTALFIGSEQFRNATLSLLGILGQLVGQLASALMPILDTLFQVFNQLVVQLGNALAPVLTLVGTTIQGLLGPAIAALNPIVASLQPVLQQAGDALSLLLSAITPVIDIILGVLTPTIQALLPVVSTVFTAVGDIVSKAMEVVRGVIDLVLGIISGDWSQAWDGLKTIVNGTVDLIISILRGAGQVFISVLGAAWDIAKNLTVSAWNALKETVSSAITGVIGFVRDLPGNIVAGLGAIGSLLVNAGKNLIEGLISGVKAAAGRIKDAVLGPIKDSVAAVKDFLGIASPSRLFKQFGVWTGEGMMIGLEQITPAVTRAAEDMAAAVAATVPGPGGIDLGLGSATAGAGFGGGGGVVLNQHNTMLPGTNVRQFADYVAAETQWDLATGNTLLAVGRPGNQQGMAGTDTLFGLGGL